MERVEFVARAHDVSAGRVRDAQPRPRQRRRPARESSLGDFGLGKGFLAFLLVGQRARELGVAPGPVGIDVDGATEARGRFVVVSLDHRGDRQVVHGADRERVEPHRFACPGEPLVKAAHHDQEVPILLVDGLAARVQFECAPEFGVSTRPVPLEVETDEAKRGVGFGKIRIELECSGYGSPCLFHRLVAIERAEVGLRGVGLGQPGVGHGVVGRRGPRPAGNSRHSCPSPAGCRRGNHAP